MHANMLKTSVPKSMMSRMFCYIVRKRNKPVGTSHVVLPGMPKKYFHFFFHLFNHLHILGEIGTSECPFFPIFSIRPVGEGWVISWEQPKKVLTIKGVIV
jgi:hypothetical protein